MTLSINTNTAAMAALESLSSTSTALKTTEQQVSTGLKVGSAQDNPAIYAISQSMTGNISGLSAVSDSLSLGAQIVNTASKAASDIISTLQTLQNTVTLAGQTGIDMSTMQTQVANAINQINNYARNSTFNGINILTSASDSGTAMNASANIVTGLQGSTLAIGNQADIISSGATVLSNALGLTSNLANKASSTSTTQSVLNSASTGVNIATTSSLSTSDFSAGSNVQLTNGDGTTTTFEFDDGTSATTSTESATNHVVVVLVDSTTESSSAMLGKLVDSMNSNGYNAVLQNDGSVNVTGKGVSASTAAGAGGSGSNTGISTGTTLTESQSAITTIQSAINSMDKISTTLGATSQEITGMQSFTSDLSDALTTGVGGLTDADLSAASAKLTSLQTKQQLAIQSLSIANAQSSSILSLFRG